MVPDDVSRDKPVLLLVQHTSAEPFDAAGRPWRVIAGYPKKFDGWKAFADDEALQPKYWTEIPPFPAPY
jgi:hypothetical protein